jgi:hypothetical protein
MPQTPAYYRARLVAIADEMKSETDEKRIRLLQNGYTPDLHVPQPYGNDNSPLTFLELCSWDTWFTMHPEKVCGKTVVMTSRSFPLAVKASKEDVIKTVSAGIEKTQQTRIRIAKAKLKLLKLSL